ncbi:MAG: hypothetical protein KJO95_01710 [Gammaproteobacteria bacterium]|nr:hypothetical protein [Gammaproteobacteria bacterium]MBU2677474.1 hypothetical protein [Gammaproteobacteria bacterium]NNC58164.1 hypothetical protein [Woeseiaceae bacterium]NNL51207.1 hypothetical protein [Woeseiaceae bacterium]
MKKKLLSLTILTLFSTSVLAEASYLCVADHISGFHFDEDLQTWKDVTFLPGERFVIKEQPDGAYQVERMDRNGTWTATCSPRTDQTDDSFSCMGGANQFHFNRKELRFTAFRYFGYWNGSTDSLSISIGRCFRE